MKLSLELIKENLENFNAELLLSNPENKNVFQFTHIQFLSSASDSLSPETLYVCETRVLPRINKQLFETCCFVFNAPPAQKQCKVLHLLNGIMLNEGANLYEVANQLMELFNKFNDFEFTTSRLSLERNRIEPMFELIEEKLPHCVMWVTDAGYNLLCKTNHEPTGIEFIDSFINAGYFDREHMETIGASGYLEDERKYERAILYDADKTVAGKHYLVRSYMFKGIAFSFAGCYFVDRPPTLSDIAYFEIFTSELARYYSRNHLLNSDGINAQYRLINDMIHGNVDDPDYIRDRSEQLKLPFYGNLRIGVIGINIDSSIKISQIVNQLRASCTLELYGVFQYGINAIIVFKDWNMYSAKEQANFQSEWNALMNTLRKNSAFIGISPVFKSMSSFGAKFKQALNTMQIGHERNPNSVVYFYSEYCLEDMLLNYSKVIPLDDVYVQYLEQLIDKDNKGLNSDINLLYCYLYCERNISKTAVMMHMHRNSVIYRIQKIEEALPVDLNNQDVRIRLIISLKILEMQGKISLNCFEKDIKVLGVE